LIFDQLFEVGCHREPGNTVVSRELERQGGVVNVVGALLLIGRKRRTPVLEPAAQPVYSTTPRTRTQIRSGFISVHESYLPADEPIVVPPLHGIGINN